MFIWLATLDNLIHAVFPNNLIHTCCLDNLIHTGWSKSRWTVKNFYLKITRLLTKDKIKDQIE